MSSIEDKRLALPTSTFCLVADRCLHCKAFFAGAIASVVISGPIMSGPKAMPLSFGCSGSSTFITVNARRPQRASDRPDTFLADYSIYCVAKPRALGSVASAPSHQAQTAEAEQ